MADPTSSLSEMRLKKSLNTHRGIFCRAADARGVFDILRKVTKGAEISIARIDPDFKAGWLNGLACRHITHIFNHQNDYHPYLFIPDAYRFSNYEIEPLLTSARNIGRLIFYNASYTPPQALLQRGDCTYIALDVPLMHH